MGLSDEQIINEISRATGTDINSRTPIPPDDEPRFRAAINQVMKQHGVTREQSARIVRSLMAEVLAEKRQWLSEAEAELDAIRRLNSTRHELLEAFGGETLTMRKPQGSGFHHLQEAFHRRDITLPTAMAGYLIPSEMT
ncbi:MAG TPA: hypothetical protein VEJ63_05565, partial [Planctomycetota bacterium]|nr:hypothetical protein [Planctomycetota bacterium]